MDSDDSTPVPEFPEPVRADDTSELPSLADPTPVGEPLLIVSSDVDETARSGSRRRVVAAAAIVAVALVAVGAVIFVTRDDVAPPDADVALDAWAPYWVLDDSLAAAPERLALMRTISPFWYNADGVDTISIDTNTDVVAADAFMELARSSGAEVVPSIVDALPAGEMAAILADPTTRRRHVEAIVAFAEDFDGVDLDYEKFAFVDGRETWATTRPAWVAFVEELGAELHAAGRTLTVSIPPVYDDERSATSGYWVYDHGAIAAHVDRIRIMAYDYSVAEPGPIAPLAFVERSVDGALATGVEREKLVLGLPIYGRNWPTGVTGTCPPDAALEDMTSVNSRTVDDLIERRGATPVYNERTGEWSFEYELEFSDDTTTCVQQRRVQYVDADGAKLRMDIAREKHIGGVSLWAFGFDDDAVWSALTPTIARR